MDINNLTNVYNNNPTLQGSYTLQQYLDLFGGSSTPPTPDPDPDPDPTPDPDPDPTPGSGQGIIGADMDRGNGIQSLQSTFSKDLSGDPRFNYLKPNEQANKYRFDRSVEPRDGLMGYVDKIGNKFKESKFFQPKIRGTLGNRLQKQSELGKKLPSFISAIASMQSPFNPNSKNYNRQMSGQLNYLEGTDGTKLTGKKDPYTGETIFTETSAPMIGIDSQSGIKKYGPGTVLEGLNVTSGFGSNNLVTALDRYIDKMKKRGTKDGVYDEKNLTPYQLEKLKKAKIEKQSYYDTSFKNEQERQAQIEEDKFQANLDKKQRRQRQRDLDTIDQAYKDFAAGNDKNYSGGDFSKGRTRDDKPDSSGATYNDPFDPGGGEKDGGHIDGTNRRKDYRYGGRASYFNGGIASFKNGGRINFKGGGRIGLFLGGNLEGGYSESRKDSGKKQTTVSFGGGGGGGGGGNNNPPPVVKTPPPKKPKPKVKKNISTGSFFPSFNFLKKFRAHDKYTDQLKASEKPNYHELGGLDFMARFPNLNPDIAKGLATGYQNMFEVGRALADGPGGMTVGNALNKAKEESRLNAAGIDAYANPDSSLYQNYFNQDSLTGAVPFNNQSMATGGRVNYFNGGIVSLRRR